MFYTKKGLSLTIGELVKYLLENKRLEMTVREFSFINSMHECIFTYGQNNWSEKQLDWAKRIYNRLQINEQEKIKE